MDDHEISLSALAYACRVYDAMTDFGRSFGEFQTRVKGNPDLGKLDHRRALLKWLNAWGCRNLALVGHEAVSRELAAWYGIAKGQLPESSRRLVEMHDADLVKSAKLFDDLAGLPAQWRVRNGRRFVISFGPTAASKTLFALRPEVFVPWDELIRRRLVPDDSGASYVDFLKRVRGDLREVARRYSERGITPEGLPARLRRPRSTAPQLIGEYYWITITRKVEIPDASTLSDWLAWSQRPN